jgi:hypothetical protein
MAILSCFRSLSSQKNAENFGPSIARLFPNRYLLNIQNQIQNGSDATISVAETELLTASVV